MKNQVEVYNQLLRTLDRHTMRQFINYHVAMLTTYKVAKALEMALLDNIFVVSESGHIVEPALEDDSCVKLMVSRIEAANEEAGR